MTTDLENMMQAIGLQASAFSARSRYHGTGTAVVNTPAGETVVFLRRRFVPQAERFSLLQEHTVQEGERLDHIAYQYTGDPEWFWQICDANNALNPLELEEPGKNLRITLPAGIPGYENA